MLISNFFPDDGNEDAFKEDINSDIDFPLYEEIHGIDMNKFNAISIQHASS